MIAQGLKRYKTVQITTGSPGETLLLLYDALFRFLGEAATAMRAGDLAKAGEKISRAHELLSELAMSLNPKYAPELCENLKALYLFCMNHIVSANLKREAEGIDEVIRILAPLRDAWVTAVRTKSDAPRRIGAVP